MTTGLISKLKHPKAPRYTLGEGSIFFFQSCCSFHSLPPTFLAFAGVCWQGGKFSPVMDVLTRLSLLCEAFELEQVCVWKVWMTD